MSKPDFSYEKRYWGKGYSLVIGIDEVGRGAFAGPVVAAAAAFRSPYFPQFIKISHVRKCDESGNSKSLEYVLKLGIDDSKKLLPKKREKLVKEIKKYFYCGVGESSVTEINRLGIVKATKRAMRRAIKSIKYQVLRIKYKKEKIPNTKCYVLIDAFHVKYILGVGLENQEAIIHGDQRSVSIAAASILAKVYRDNLMRQLSHSYPHYHWGECKGYGTKKHQEAIRKFGITKLHRKKFVESWHENILTSSRPRTG